MWEPQDHGEPETNHARQVHGELALQISRMSLREASKVNTQAVAAATPRLC